MKTCWAGTMKCCFNPRTPCGVRLSSKGRKNLPIKFQSTHSLRSATLGVKLQFFLIKVSIHALLAECDFNNGKTGPQGYCFNPRTPCGVRRRAGKEIARNTQFQSTHSLRSATIRIDLSYSSGSVSIHALLAECDRRNGLPPHNSPGFQSTHSLRSATLTLCACGRR